MAAMFGPRSGTMVPDKVPRKVMGGGFRAHSPPRSSLTATGVGISPRMNARHDDAAGTPRSGHAAKRPGRAPSGKEKLILAQEQEAADIEREYIKNLQQQVYYLELELNYTKSKGRPPQEPHQAQQQQAQTPSGSELGGGGGAAFRQEPPPSAGGAAGALEGSGAAPAAPATTPYAAVAAVREAADRACQELQRTRTQQLEEAASRAYEITASHLASHIERLELEGFRMADVVEQCATWYEQQQEQHRNELVAVASEKAALERRLQTAAEELRCVREERDGYRDDIYDTEGRLQDATNQLEKLREERTQLETRLKNAGDALHQASFERDEFKAQLLKNEGSLTAAEEVALKESTAAAQMALEEEKAAREELEREVEGLRKDKVAQREEVVKMRLERDALQAQLAEERGKRASEDSKLKLAAVEQECAHLKEDMAGLKVELEDAEGIAANARREVDGLKSKLQQQEGDVAMHLNLRTEAETKLDEIMAKVAALEADKEAALLLAQKLRGEAQAAQDKYTAAKRELDTARRSSDTHRLSQQVADAADTSLQ